MNVDEMIEKIEKGEPVNWQRVANAQPLELLAAGQRFADEARQLSEEADRAMEQMIQGAGNGAATEQRS